MNLNRLILFVITLIGINSCDDGDIIFQDVSFQNDNISACNVGLSNFFIFNIQENQAYIIRIPESNFNNFQNINAPISLPIGGSVSLTLRTYNRNITSNDLCNTIPPADLIVSNERIAQSGTIEITTRAIRSAPDSNNATRIVSYQHQVLIKNLTLGIDGNLQFIDQLLIGFYNTSATTFQNFNSVNIQSCDNNNLKFKIIQNQALEMLAPPSLFANEATPVGQPRMALIDANHRLRYLVFNEFVNQGNFCGTSLLNPTQTWEAEAGVANSSGIIEVTTQQDTDPNTAQIIYRHNITLKNIRFIRPTDNVDFLLGNTYDFGELITQ